MAPRTTASALLAAANAASVNGSPWASIEAYRSRLVYECNAVKSWEKKRVSYAAKEVLLKIKLQVTAMFLDDTEDLFHILFLSYSNSFASRLLYDGLSVPSMLQR